VNPLWRELRGWFIAIGVTLGVLLVWTAIALLSGAGDGPVYIVH
jgi:hypothetical protein